MLNDISITSGFPVVKGDSPDNSNSRNAIVLVGLGPGKVPGPITGSRHNKNGIVFT